MREAVGILVVLVVFCTWTLVLLALITDAGRLWREARRRADRNALIRRAQRSGERRGR